MNFEEFKRRYIEKLKRAGIEIPEEHEPNYVSFQDHMATIYVGLTIYSEFQREEAEKQVRAHKERLNSAALSPKIIVPDGIKH